MSVTNGTSLEARVSALEQALAELQAAPPADQLAPNGLTVNPITGLITLSTLLNVGNEITWQSGGVSGIGQILEELIAGAPNTWRMLLESYSPNVGDISQVLLEAVETGGSAEASLSVVQQTGGSGTSAAIDVTAGAESVRLLDQAGNSGYIRTPFGATQLAVGATAIVFSGGMFGGSALVNPGLGPLAGAIAIADQAFGNTAITCTCHLANPGVSPSFQVNGYYPPGGLSASVGAYWIAFT